MLGGTLFLGFIAAVAFATILAVVAGLTLAGASALSHDIYVARGQARPGDREGAGAGGRRRHRASSASLAVLLGVLFKGQNVAFMVGLAFAVACSANFPALLLSIVWKRFTTRGAVASILTGALLSVVLIVLSPTVWVDLLGNATAPFPLNNPAIVSMTVAVLVGVAGFTVKPRANRRGQVRWREAADLPRGGGGVGLVAPSARCYGSMCASGTPCAPPALQMRPQLRVVEFRLGSELLLRRIDETQPFEMTAEEATVAA